MFNLLIAAFAMLSGVAGAVELGEPLVRSHIGQPLSADIELTGLTSDAVPLQAAVADLDVYRAASTAMPAALDGAAISIVRRDGRRFVHIASPVVVKAEHLVVFLALTENGQRVVRQTTLWLTPDPNPAPPVALVKAAPPPAPVPASVPAAAVAAVVATAQAPAPLAAPKPAAAPFLPAPASVRHPVTLPRAPAASPACATPGSAVTPDPTCVALDSKNAALTAHLAELEGKIKQLNAALQGGALAAGDSRVAKEASIPAAAVAAAASSAAPAPPLAVAAAAPPAKKAPPPQPLPAKLVPMGSTPPPASGGNPWLVIGIVAAIIVSLVGALTAVLLRQRRSKLKKKASEVIAAAARPSFISNVKNRLMPSKAAPVVAVVEEEDVANTQPAL